MYVKLNIKVYICTQDGVARKLNVHMSYRKIVVGGRIFADFTEHMHNIILLFSCRMSRVRKMAVELFCFLMVRGRLSAQMENLHQCISSMETSSM